MGFYGEKIAPRLINKACAAAAFAPWRQKVCEELSGRVLEIGFGSGHNVPFYPSSITTVSVVEPSELAMKLASKRIKSAFVPIERVGSDARALALEDESVDAALSSFTLCTVPDPTRVLLELARVLKPGGRYHFLEHGLSPSRALAISQHLLDPLEWRLGGGCHLTRQPLSLIRDAGFELLWSEEGPARGPKPWCYCSAGVAVRA